jgi:hypothetical protein
MARAQYTQKEPEIIKIEKQSSSFLKHTTSTLDDKQVG